MEECMFFDAEQLMQTDCGVRAPLGMRNREDVFAFYSSTLSFPDYFGWNWDAFDECIKDLSWIGNTTIHIIHDEIPLKTDQHQCTIFLSTIHESKFYSRVKNKLCFHFRALDKHYILDILFKHYRGLEYYHTNEYLEFYRKESRWNENPDIALATIDKGLAMMYMADGFLDKADL